jgi:hypothetical protein
MSEELKLTSFQKYKQLINGLDKLSLLKQQEKFGVRCPFKIFKKILELFTEEQVVKYYEDITIFLDDSSYCAPENYNVFWRKLTNLLQRMSVELTPENEEIAISIFNDKVSK